MFFYFYFFLTPIVVKAYQLCHVEEKSKSFLPESNGSPTYRMVYCNSDYQECCSQGCCPSRNSSEYILELGNNEKTASFLCFFAILLILSYLYFCCRYCGKKLCRRSQNAIHRDNTQPQELNLMLSFNQTPGTPERFNFDNLNSAHLHVPFVPTTPVTPPPAYVTLTPPPTYNVAIHFPPVQQEKINETGNLQN